MRRGSVVLVVLAGCLAAVPARAAVAPIQKGRIARSDTCGECHKDIYRMWRASAHARSMQDPVFLDAYHQTKQREGAAVGRVCLGCHAPSVELTHDFELEQQISWEGVSCDICHSIVSVEDVGGTPRFKLDPGRIKRGPLRDASSMAHEVAYSELHTQALVCAPCHEFTNSAGVPIMTTYSEWKKSAASRAGKTCQQCHMGRAEANVVDPVVKRVPGHEVNLHEVPGGHSLEQLHKALTVSLQPRREGNELIVGVRIKNGGAGHAVPTGMPGRHVILTVTGRTSDGGSFEEKRVYAKSFTGAGGAEITRDASYFARGVRLVGDNRLQPGDERDERFRFRAPASATVFLTVRLNYEHSPTGNDQNRTWITFFSEERTLQAETPGRP